MSSLLRREPVSIERYAWTVAAPREFLINLAINWAVPWWILPAEHDVAIFGERSPATIFLPMMAILGGLTTFFGYVNGMVARRRGIATPPIAPGTRWLRSAVISALVWAGWGLLFGWAVIETGELSIASNATVDRNLAAAVNGLWAACVAFVLHGRAAIRAGRIGLFNT